MLAGSRSRNKVRLILGARQTGKTVLLGHLLSADRTAVFDLQDTRLRRQFERDPARLRDELKAMGRDIANIVIDEIQKVPELLEEVQHIYDGDPCRWQFFLTGSSARKLRQHSSNLLPGRSHVYHLYPVVRYEEAAYKARIRTSARKAASVFPARSLEKRLIYGNLPGISGEAGEVAGATLDSYVENYLEEEIRREGLVKNIGAFDIFLRLAAYESGMQVNLSRLSQECGVPASTLKIYYQVLVDTFVGYWVGAYGRSGRKRLLTTPKFMFFDLGVRNTAARLSLVERLDPDTGGRLLEQWVGIELRHRAAYAGRRHDVTFWRTTSGAEVDFIWQSPGEEVPIEVKWTDNPQPGDARHVETFIELYPRAAKRGLVVCRIPRARQLTERVTAIPWDEL